MLVVSVLPNLYANLGVLCFDRFVFFAQKSEVAVRVRVAVNGVQAIPRRQRNNVMQREYFF